GNEDADSAANKFDGGRYADPFPRTLADTAMYHYKRDLQPTYADLVPLSRLDQAGAAPGAFAPGQSTMHQHMKTYALAFGVRGTIDPLSIPANPVVPFAWTDPLNAPEHKIDDLLHAALNGRGEYLNAANPPELQAALERAFLAFTQAGSSTSSAAFNSTSLEEGTLLYRGFYDLRYNTGELSATAVARDGSLAPTPLWRASQQLDAKAADQRVMVTWDRAAARGIPFRYSVLNAAQKALLSESEARFLRGDRSVEQPTGTLRKREPEGGLLGDIVNSSPVFVGAPRGINRDQTPYPLDTLYSSFASRQANRTPVVYVGANDGSLHGFHARTGEELMAYVPNKLIDATLSGRNALDQFASPFYQHRYFVDLTPRLNDVFLRTPTAPARSWRTVLVGGLGGGGKGFYALDVTDPALFADETRASSTVLWEFTDEDDTYPLTMNGTPLGGSEGALRDPSNRPVKDLGYAVSLPVIAMSNAAEGDGDKAWVALFGNGQNSTAGIAKLFALFIERGQDGWQPGDVIKLDTGFGVPMAGPLAGFPNGLGSPASVDVNLDGTVDRVYAGDRLGNLFRFDLSAADPSAWRVTRLFTASYTDNGVQTVQPVLAQPLVIPHPTADGFLVIFGTGSYLTREDARNTDIQSLYAIWDRGEPAPATAQGARELRLVEQSLINILDTSTTPQETKRVFPNTQPVEYRPDRRDCSSGTCVDEPGVYGWYVDLDLPAASLTTSGQFIAGVPAEPQYPGERAIRRIIERNGALVTTTVLPALDEFSCFGTRPGAVLVLSALTGGDAGQPLIDFNNDGRVDEGDLVAVDDELRSPGLLMNQTELDGQLVDLATLSGEGSTDFLFVSGGNDTIAYLIDSARDRRTGRLSWRELDFAE
ncbi:MAG: pilus assembly protein, partial [Pseudomonadales bacterium]